MKRSSGGIFAVWLFFSVLSLAQNAPPESKEPPRQTTGNAEQSTRNIEILSDTNGVDFDPYLAVVVKQVRTNWYNLVPEVARAPLMKKGKASVTFKVLKDGSVSEMKLVERSGDESLDRAALGGIMASAPFPALPKEFTGQYLSLRFHFHYNPGPTSSVLQIIPSGPLTVAAGKSVKFTASAGHPYKNATIKWALVIGRYGCEPACGTISGEGLYTAPTKVPESPVITVTATAEVDPSITAWVSLKIVAEEPSH